MGKAIVLLIICFLLSIPSPAFCQAGSDPHSWSGNVNLFLGAKFLDEDDWEPVDEHVEGGILVDFKQNWLPFSIAIDLLYSGNDQNIGIAVFGFGTFSAHVESRTTEVNLGIRKIWEKSETVRPFIGGGVAIINAELESKALGVSESDDDIGVGAWIDAGIYLTLKRRFNIGIDARWSRAEVDLFGVTGQAGGWHFGAMAGFHW
jgi:hypothetical protein